MWLSLRTKRRSPRMGPARRAPRRGGGRHWATTAISWPNQRLKARNLRTSRSRPTISKNAGVSRTFILVERFAGLPENRGVPGSSPGLAIGRRPCKSGPGLADIARWESPSAGDFLATRHVRMTVAVPASNPPVDGYGKSSRCRGGPDEETAGEPVGERGGGSEEGGEGCHADGPADLARGVERGGCRSVESRLDCADRLGGQRCHQEPRAEPSRDQGEDQRPERRNAARPCEH